MTRRIAMMALSLTLLAGAAAVALDKVACYDADQCAGNPSKCDKDSTCDRKCPDGKCSDGTCGDHCKRPAKK